MQKAARVYLSFRIENISWTWVVNHMLAAYEITKTTWILKSSAYFYSKFGVKMRKTFASKNNELKTKQMDRLYYGYV